MAKDFYSTEQVGQILGLTRQRILQLINANKIKTVNAGSRGYLISHGEVMRYIDEMEEKYWGNGGKNEN